MKDKKSFIVFSALSLGALVFYDWWAITQKKTTVSKAITTTAKKHLIIPFVWGFITGHLFWSQKYSGSEE